MELPNKLSKGEFIRHFQLNLHIYLKYKLELPNKLSKGEFIGKVGFVFWRKAKRDWKVKNLLMLLKSFNVYTYNIHIYIYIYINWVENVNWNSQISKGLFTRKAMEAWLLAKLIFDWLYIYIYMNDTGIDLYQVNFLIESINF